MGLFDKQISSIGDYIAKRNNDNRIIELPYLPDCSWPSGEGSNVVLVKDTAVELGNPKNESVSFLLWSDRPESVNDSTISVIGPDLKSCTGKSIPFGKAVIVGGRNFNADNSYDRYREMEVLRYDIDLKGYMMRGVSQYMREWSRVSYDAIDKGFSLGILGSSLIDRFRKLDYVDSVEVVFVTGESEDVRELKKTSGEVMNIISAMNKMFSEMSFECNTCEYQPVCDEVSELKDMRERLHEG
jgi:CO dehydrogenase/acetyl-CoA synthase beta subunit